MGPALVVTVLLAQVSAYPPQTPTAEPPESTEPTVFRGALELSAAAFPSGAGADPAAPDLFGFVTPLLAVDAGEGFGFELGAHLRLRAVAADPSARAGDAAGVLRGADWDERSDFGQLLRSLRVGADSAPVFVRAGALPLTTLGHGHLINRYSNQTNPDYHPAGGTLTANGGPVHAELFASDLLAARLFGAEVAFDVGQLFFAARPELADRFHAAISAAHDFGRARAVSAPVTLAALDGDAALVRNEGFHAQAYVNLSARLLEVSPSLGAALGARAQGTPGPLELGGRLEVRKQGGGFQHGLFGAEYELSRFASVGLSGPGAADVLLPDSGSGYGEVELGMGPVDADESGAGRLSVSAASEVFFWGRVDADLAVAARTPGNKGVLTLRASVQGANQSPRVDLSAMVRYRLVASVYALAQGGTVYVPQPDGTLVRGLYAGLGVGLDFER